MTTNFTHMIMAFEKQQELELSFFKMINKSLFENQYQKISQDNSLRIYNKATMGGVNRNILMFFTAKSFYSFCDS